MKFKEFSKIARLNRGMVVTEKIDGTNAQVYIINKLDLLGDLTNFCGYVDLKLAENETHMMFAGSRTRWITPHDDNYGFAGWVQRNSEELFKLGEGQHFGEWYGNGIQRRYGLMEKKFALFNTGRWYDSKISPIVMEDEKRFECPSCCEVVPVLFEGDFDVQKINEIVTDLKVNGSKAAPGFMNAEGIVVYHVASRTLYKVTCEKDESPKSQVNNAS